MTAPSFPSRSGCASLRSHPRGTAIAAVLVLILLAGVIITGFVLTTGRDFDMTVRRVETLHAFYAAESGVNMAVREMMLGVDEDGDGGVGTISDNGDPDDDPTLLMGGFSVTAETDDDEQTVLRSAGIALDAQRVLSVALISAMGGYSSSDVDDMQVASRFTLEEETTLTTLAAAVKGPPPKKLRYAIYSDDDGEPGELLVESDVDTVGSNTFHWHGIAIPETTLQPGDYWFTLTFEHRNMHYRFDASGETRLVENDAVKKGFTDPWGDSEQSLTQTVSMQLTDTEGAVIGNSFTFGDWSETGAE